MKEEEIKRELKEKILFLKECKIPDELILENETINELEKKLKKV